MSHMHTEEPDPQIPAGLRWTIGVLAAFAAFISAFSSLAWALWFALSATVFIPPLRRSIEAKIGKKVSGAVVLLLGGGVIYVSRVVLSVLVEASAAAATESASLISAAPGVPMWVGLLLVVAVLLFGWVAYKSERENDALRTRLARITDMEAETKELRQKQRHAHRQLDALQGDILDATTELSLLRNQIEVAEAEIGAQEVGLYHPLYDFDSADEYKDALAAIRQAQKAMVKNKTAAVCGTEWMIEGSRAKGKKQTDQLLKLMLRAFNGDSDSHIATVRHDNVQLRRKQIRSHFAKINKLATVQDCRITSEYMDLKLRELSLVHEWAEKRQEEKEEQRRIRNEMREEQKAQREIERARKEAEKEERRAERALRRAREEMANAVGEQKAGLAAQIVELTRKLEEARTMGQRAMSRAQMTRSGHVYVISNLGSFGEGVLKIGMTRRLEPLDRVRELGDASVPFRFDVHAMIYSDDAPALEAELHQIFDEQRVNLVNRRKEFFRITVDEVEAAVRKIAPTAKFRRTAKATEFRESEMLSQERRAA